MARVNHKLVKQRLNEKRSKITDRQFFTSRILAGHFEDIAEVQTKRYKYNRRVRVNLYWHTKEDYIADTNNLSIRINCGNKLITHVRGRENRYRIICGVFAHELGHNLFTDFLAAQTHENFLASYRWYPAPPTLKTADDLKNESAIWSYAKADPKNLEMLQFIAHQISNILEDGYIENRMLMDFPGTLGLGLAEFRQLHFEQIPTVTQMIEFEDSGRCHIFESIMQIILSYAKFGEIKYGDEPLSDERIQTVFSLLHDIDSAILSRSCKERFGVVNTVLVRCWNYIEEYLELCKKHHDEAVAAGSASGITETLAEMLKSIAGDSAAAEGDTSPVASVTNEETSSATAESRAKTNADAKEENSPQTETEKDEKSSESDDENSDSENTEDNESIPGGSSKNGDGKQDVSEYENGRMPYQQTEELFEPVGGTTTVNREYQRNQYDRAAKDIERILDKMAEKAACAELENERIRELNDVAQNIAYGDIHSGINIKINRIADVDEELVEQYDCISAPLLTISRQMQRSLLDQLEDRRRGGKQTGLMFGRRLDAHTLCRNDGKIFYKTNLPNEMPEIAVGFLGDESGSMCSCDRATYARASAIIMYDFCQNLDIPILIYGHSTSGSVDLYSYAEFESFDKDDKYRLMDISARGSNRDGAAIRFVAEQLLKRPEEIKLLFLVSDGQPADSGYYGTAAEEDLRGIKQEYTRKGIIFVAAAIGSDKQNIERIYGDSFLDITDLNQLPAKLINVIKRHIRV